MKQDRITRMKGMEKEKIRHRERRSDGRVRSLAMHKDFHESGHEAKGHARGRVLEPVNSAALYPLLKQPWIITQMLRVSSSANKVDANGSASLRRVASRVAWDIILLFPPLFFFFFIQHSYSPYLFHAAQFRDVNNTSRAITALR